MHQVLYPTWKDPVSIGCIGLDTAAEILRYETFPYRSEKL
jgi:hypothetical protein